MNMEKEEIIDTFTNKVLYTIKLFIRETLKMIL